MSSNCDLQDSEKIQLARTYKVASWFEEGISSLVDPGHAPLSDDEMTTLGWKTSALVLWIQINANHDTKFIRFRKDSIKCANCASPDSLLQDEDTCHNCFQALRPADELLFQGGAGRSTVSDSDRNVHYGEIKCHKCKASALQAFGALECQSCLGRVGKGGFVRVTPKQRVASLIKEKFGEEFVEYAT